MRKRIVSLLTALILLCSLSTAAFAHEVPDLTKDGSVSVTMHCGSATVSGGTLKLYRVGEVAENNGDYSFALTGDFMGFNGSLTDLQSADLAEDLAAYAADHSLQGETATVGSDGKALFDELELGLYLLVQETAADGYYKAEPFLVSVPYFESGSYLYDVDASPKVELEQEPAGDEPKDDTPAKTPSKTPTKLPQTGQLNWPVPVLVLAGLTLMIMGLVIRRNGKRDNAK